MTKMFDRFMNETTDFTETYYIVFNSDEDAIEWWEDGWHPGNTTGLENPEEGSYCYDEYIGEWINSLEVMSRVHHYMRMYDFNKSGMRKEG